MKNLSEKKLLVITSDSNDLAFVQAAREMGIYVVCCDRYSDWEISPAKAVADEAWNINYKDTETVVNKCKERGIDGVIAGYGEDRVLAACKISKAIGTPFYASEEQIEITRNKRLFKSLCRKHGIPVPTDYCFSLPLSQAARESIVYPVIVKPDDNGGRKGISICYKETELDEAIELASSQSKNGEIIIEEYISGIELCSVYTLANGKISLSCLNDKYISEDQNGLSRLCDLVLTPSKHYDLYLNSIDSKIKELMYEIGAKNGVANFQFIVDKDEIKAFEMGYRVNGNDDFKVIRANNGIDFLKMLISHSITGEMNDDLKKDNPNFSKYHCTLCMYLHSGTIGEIDYQGLLGKKNIDDICILRNPGAVIVEDGTNRQKVLLVKSSAQTLPEIVDLIHTIQANIIIKDINGNNMLLKPFDTGRLSLN